MVYKKRIVLLAVTAIGGCKGSDNGSQVLSEPVQGVDCSTVATPSVVGTLPANAPVQALNPAYNNGYGGQPQIIGVTMQDAVNRHLKIANPKYDNGYNGQPQFIEAVGGPLVLTVLNPNYNNGYGGQPRTLQVSVQDAKSKGMTVVNPKYDGYNGQPQYIVCI